MLDGTIRSSLISGFLLFTLNCECQFFQSLNTRFPMGASEEIFQDSEGYLWIGTVNGLVRFDGYTTFQYVHEPDNPNSISGNNVNGVYQDSLGRIWIGLSSYGLDVLNKEFNHFTHICLPDPGGECYDDISVNDFALFQEDIIWAGTEHGLYKIAAGDSIQVLDHFVHDPDDPSSLAHSYVLYTYVDSRDRLWIGTLDGLNRYDPKENAFINHNQNDSYPQTQILDIREDRRGMLWVSVRYSPERLLWLDESSGQFRTDEDFIGQDLGEFRIAFDRENDLWISSRGNGAYFRKEGTHDVKYFDPELAVLHGFRNDYSLHTICDKYGNIWMVGEHVMKRPATRKNIFQINTNDDQVLSVYASGSKIWYSANKPMRFDRITGQTEEYWPVELPSSLPKWASRSKASNRIHCIRRYDDDHVVFTTVRNVYFWNLNTNSYREYLLDYGGPFRDFIFGKSKDEIWICGNQGHPIHLNLNTGRDTIYETAKAILSPRSVTKDASGILWFGTTDKGIYRFNSENGDVVHFAPDLKDLSKRLTDYSINDIKSAGDVIWAATNLGLNRIDTKTNSVTSIRKQDGFENENILSLLVDDHSNLWLATQSGLVYFNPETNAFRHFDRADGMINSSYVIGSAHKDDNGWLYFGGDRGVDYFDPNQMGSNTIPPDLYLSKVLVNNLPADTSVFAAHLRSLTLNHSQNFIEVELLALHLTSPEGNQYSYKITELDTVWRDLGTRRTITLANLRPGEYTLEAKASNSDGVWCVPKTMLRVVISPPFWATWWFICTVVLFLLLLIAAAYNYRVKQIQTRERLKTEFNKRIAELESKALRAQMNPHFLFNSINSVKSLISQGEDDKATQYLTRFGQLIRQVLSNSEKPFVRLQEELEALRLYLDIEQLRFQNFEYSIEVDSNVNVDFIEVPPLILQPYVENAIWHGLMHKTSGDRKVYIRVRVNGDFLDMSVEDNGIGREKAGQMKMLGNTRKGGMGMRLTGDRISLLHTLYGQEVSIVVRDLAENGAASGTRVEIRIPYDE